MQCIYSQYMGNDEEEREVYECRSPEVGYSETKMCDYRTCENKYEDDGYERIRF